MRSPATSGTTPAFSTDWANRHFVLDGITLAAGRRKVTTGFLRRPTWTCCIISIVAEAPVYSIFSPAVLTGVSTSLSLMQRLSGPSLAEVREPPRASSTYTVWNSSQTKMHAIDGIGKERVILVHTRGLVCMVFSDINQRAYGLIAIARRMAANRRQV